MKTSNYLFFIFNLPGTYGKESGGGWKLHYEYLIVQSFIFAVGLANTWRLPSLTQAHGGGKDNETLCRKGKKCITEVNYRNISGEKY